MPDASIRQPPGPRPQPIGVRFWRNVDQDAPGGCWLWTGGVTGGGHPRMRIKQPDGRWGDEYAYRVAWELVHGAPPVGDLPSTCGVERCINPEHRRDVSTSESRRANVLSFWHDTDEA